MELRETPGCPPRGLAFRIHACWTGAQSSACFVSDTNMKHVYLSPRGRNHVYGRVAKNARARRRRLRYHMAEKEQKQPLWDSSRRTLANFAFWGSPETRLDISIPPVAPVFSGLAWVCFCTPFLRGRFDAARAGPAAAAGPRPPSCRAVSPHPDSRPRVLAGSSENFPF